MWSVKTFGGERAKLTGRTSRKINFRQTKIEDFCVAAAGNEDINGFDVAVNDARGMRGVEGIGNFDGQRKQIVKVEGTAGDFVFQGDAVEIFHGNEVLPLMLADFIEVQMLGWLRAEAVRASRRKRSRAWGSCETLSGRNFRAT